MPVKENWFSNKRMKIALLFAGHLRNGISFTKDTIDYFRRQQGVEQVDAYLHITWDPELVGKCIGFHYDNMIVQEDDPTEEIMRVINPKKLKLEKQVDICLDDIPEFNPVYATAGSPVDQDKMYFSHITQTISFKKVLDLVENLSEYDAIIRTRCDLKIMNPDYEFPVHLLMKPQYVITTHGMFIDGYEWGDWFYGGRPETIVLLANNLESLYRSYLQSRYAQNLKKEGVCTELKRFLIDLHLDHTNLPLLFKLDRDHYPLKKINPGENPQPGWYKNMKRKNISYV
jgi:hypothetical protein